MLDFTSSLYLGLRHPSRALAPWESLTVGAPAALAEPKEYRLVARELAWLQGCEEGVLATSTLHLFWDLFGMLGAERLAVFVDRGAYPIACWGAERAGARGAAVTTFPHHDAEALRRLVGRRPPGTRAVVLCDGFCPVCGTAAPLADYLAAAKRAGGLLLVDDTQALGILGERPGPGKPFGVGGGGSLRWSGIKDPAVVMVASLAKGFGSPLALLSGSGGVIGEFLERSDTRVHCSPPSTAAVKAAERSLVMNAERGDLLRLRLWCTVSRFRRGVCGTGVGLPAGPFPFQVLRAASAGELHQHLAAAGIRTVLHRPRGREVRLSFIFTALHTAEMIDRALEVVGAWATTRAGRSRGGAT